METPSQAQLASAIYYSKNDSQRFGLNIHRAAILDDIDAPKILSYVLEHNVDTAIIRIPSVKLASLNTLERTGMPYIIADTLAYYHLDLTQELKPLKNQDLEFELAGHAHHEVINKIVRATFGAYVNHYRVNPFFDNEQVTEGYQDWMRNYAEGDPDRVLWLVKKEGKYIGFCTFNFQREGKVKGILYGVLPEYRREGIFRDMIRYAQHYAKNERGCTYMRVTSQIENVNAQRCWTSDGFSLHHTVNTVHINAALTKSIFEPFTVDITLDDEEKSSPKVANRHILKYINWEFDRKQNIVTRNHRFVNLVPLEFGKQYQLKFSYPMGSRGLLRVIDHAGCTCMLVYFDLKHFVA
jgi:RimJ/RimL family protein N-acetyltransferase